MVDTLKLLYQSVVNGDADLARSTAEQALILGIDPLEATQDGLVRGIKEVGEKFGRGELFIVDLVMGAEAFKAALDVLEPKLVEGKSAIGTVGKIVLGTVQGDIHSIGKDIVAALLSAAGFKVHNIGVDIPVDEFLERTRALTPDILGASALMSTTIPEQQRIIKALEKAGLRNRVKFFIGGAAVSERWSMEIGADAWALTANEGVQKALGLVRSSEHNS